MEQDPDPSAPYANTLNQNGAQASTTPGSRWYVLLLGSLFFSLVFFVLEYVASIDELPLMEEFIDAYCPGWQGIAASECYNPPARYLVFVRWYLRVYAVGAILGVLVAGLVVVDRLGRRTGIFIGALVFSTSCALLILFPVHVRSSILVLRGIQGFGIGMATFSSVLLWVEIAPKEARGFLGGIIQTLIVTTPLLWPFADLIDIEGFRDLWRVVYTPALVLLGVFFLVPRSPRWSYAAYDRETSEATLERLRRTLDVHAELHGIGYEVNKEERGGDRMKASARQIVIAFGLQFGQQFFSLASTVTVGDYIARKWIDDGASDDTVQRDSSNELATAFAICVIAVTPSLLALSLVDKVGRRRLLLGGSGIMALGYLALDVLALTSCTGAAGKRACIESSSFSPVTLITAMILLAFALSWGPVCWIYPFELFPTQMRAAGVAVSGAMSSALVLCIKDLYPKIYRVPFLAFACCVAAALFVRTFCPETKKMELEAIDNGPMTTMKSDQSSSHEPYAQLVDVEADAVA